MDFKALNESVIAEFRANAGVVGGMFEGADVLLLHHRGARSGIERVTPLVYRPDGEAWIVFASKAGAPTHPHWYHNLLAHPDTTIEVGAETVEVTARDLEGAERDAIFDAQATDVPQFAEYAAQTTRTIPVLRLERR